ncbi:hypothetical protein AB0N18_02705 [Streptomyces griseoincarnatus]
MTAEELTATIAAAIRQHNDVIQASELDPTELGIETASGALFIVTVHTP